MHSPLRDVNTRLTKAPDFVNLANVTKESVLGDPNLSRRELASNHGPVAPETSAHTLTPPGILLLCDVASIRVGIQLHLSKKMNKIGTKI